MKKKSIFFNRQGRRKFLTEAEREAVLRQAYQAPAHHRSLCLLLANTGCHVLEAVQLTAADVDLAGDAVMLSDTGRRLRCVPVESRILSELDAIHGISHAQQAPDRGRSAKLWPVNRTTAWRWISRIMKGAGIKGPAASPRSLRLTFIHDALCAGVPVKMLQQWVGHQELRSTDSYAKFLPAEDN